MQIATLANSSFGKTDEVAAALRRAGMEVFDFKENSPIEALLEFSGFIVLSNFADDQSDNLATALKHQCLRGKPIMGIAEGAVFLTRIGLIPGIWDNRAAITFSNEDVEEDSTFSSIRLTADYQYNAFTRYLTPQHILNVQPELPTTRFHIPPGLQLEMEMHGLNVFMYCDPKGNALEKASVAALSNKAGNVIAMLPNPFISLEADAIFLSLRDHIASQYIEQVEPLNYWPR
jgi:phosphoribosylformylglycinamidine synthase subunit PurQ / glutaminase